jgi:valyl-tRNA synthetase
MDELCLADRWILSRLGRAIRATENAFEAFRFDVASQAVYDFFWGEFCDWYIEMAKIYLRAEDKGKRRTVQQTLLRVLEGSLRLLHPLMPYVTEVLWQRLPWPGDNRPASALIVAPWVQAFPPDSRAELDMEVLVSLVRAIRAARVEHTIKPDRRIAAQIVVGGWSELLDAHRHLLATLARLDATQLQIVPTQATPADQAVVVLVAGIEVYLSLADALDVDTERKRLEKELDRVKAQMGRSQEILSNESFVTKAPPPVVARERSKLANLQDRAAKLGERLESLA